MFHGYDFHAVFTLFAIIVIKIQCADDVSIEFTTATKPTTTERMDDLRSLDMDYYCKFQPSTKKCGEKRTSRKYYFDIKLKECVIFEYGNCDNSFNMFEGKRTCLDSCRDAEHVPVSENVTNNVFCRYQPDFGNCNSYYPKWYFDASIGKCRGFAYSGCGGNQNKFATSIECLDKCGLMATPNYSNFN